MILNITIIESNSQEKNQKTGNFGKLKALEILPPSRSYPLEILGVEKI
jgi:hypothetical protein